MFQVRTSNYPNGQPTINELNAKVVQAAEDNRKIIVKMSNKMHLMGGFLRASLCRFGWIVKSDH